MKSDLPRSKEIGQMLARKMRDSGFETLPSEALDLRDKAYSKIREKLKEKGLSVPDSDLELTQLLLDAGVGKYAKERFEDGKE